MKKKLALYRVPDWFSAILADCCGRRRGIHPADKWIVWEVKNKTIALSRGPSEWVNVFAPGEDGYERFGFNLMERRWSYGMGPKGQRAIAAVLK